MRKTAWLLFFLAGSGGAQPESRPASLVQEMLTAHNTVRAGVKVAPLAWSAKLAAVAQEWADHLLAKNDFAHRPNSAYGENLFDIEGGTASPAKVVADWASEAAAYDYRTNKCGAVCGHYTQVVWADSRQVGCAVARGGGREVWACEYDPPGNMAGKRPY